MHVYRLGLAFFHQYESSLYKWVVVAFVCCCFFKHATTIPSRKKKWCQSECSVGKDRQPISIGKMTDLENSEPALYEAKSSLSL